MLANRIVIIDANVLVAAMVSNDEFHDEAEIYLDMIGPPWYVPVMALAEALHLIETRVNHQAELKVLDLVTAGEIFPINVETWHDISATAHQYSGSELGTVDASVITAAEQLQTICIATMDRKMGMVTTKKTPFFDFVHPATA